MSYVTYDSEGDVLYVGLVDTSDAKVAKQSLLDDLRIIDLSEDGAVMGVEFVDASEGVDLSDVPFAHKVAQLIEESGHPIKVFGR